jgi:hypothetical protein
MSRLTRVMLVGAPVSDEGYSALNATFGGMIDTDLVGEAERLDLYGSVRPYGRNLWVACFNHAAVGALLDEIASVRWRFPEQVTLLVRPEEASQWAVFRVEIEGRGWVTVVPPMVWDDGSWTEVLPCTGSGGDGPKWW